MTRPKRHLCVIGDSDTISKYVHFFLCCHTSRASKTWAAGTQVVFLWHTKPHTGRLLHETRQTWYPSRTTPLGTVAQDAMHANVHLRGSRFLKSWMEFLEENADLRYPNLADVYVDEQNA